MYHMYMTTLLYKIQTVHTAHTMIVILRGLVRDRILLQIIFWRCFPDASTSLCAAAGQVHEVPVLFEAVKHA